MKPFWCASPRILESFNPGLRSVNATKEGLMAETASPYDSVEHAARDAGMGERRSVFRPVRPSPAAPFIVAIPVLLCGGFIFYLLTVSGLIASFFGIVIIVGGLVAIGAAAVGIRMRWNDYRSGQELHIYDGGAIVRGKRDLIFPFRWEETRLLVSVIRRGHGAAYTYSYALLGSGNRPVVMGQNVMLVSVLTNTADEANYGDLVTAPLFDRIGEWGPMLEEGVTRAHLPRALAELSAGRPVEFGPVTATPHALTIGRTEIPWGDISGVTIDNGHLYIKRAGKLFATSQQVSHIPNFLVLVALVREYTGASLS
ncbi:DUF6585 family protein [Nonomuraea sp. NPDC046802]|uniref:DUF6585 family protein n=1 Tax=Nonomuraea sp. NPDC046802 TaxID=3154919 RepID=UPI0033CB2C48